MSERSVKEGNKKGQLPLQTTDLIVAFMAWVMLSTLLPFIKQDIPLSSEFSAWVIAIPVILGSALRIPFGYLTGKYGSRPVFIASFLILIFPIFFLSEAQTAQDLIVWGVFLGVAGAVFSVGVTSLPRYYPENKQGFVNGVYGLGNIGTAVTAFGAPFIAAHIGWQTTMKTYLILVFVMVVANIIFGDRKESKLITPITTQLKIVCKQFKLWALSFFYFVTFGTFVAFSMIMPDFMVTNYGLDGFLGGATTGIFVVLAASFRIVGGLLADRYDPTRLLVGIFAAMVVCAITLATVPNMFVLLSAVYVLGILCGTGNGIVYKMVPTYFSNQVGVASGFVAMMGGFGGFFPPLVLSYFHGITGSFTLGFLLYAACIVVCLGITLFSARRSLSGDMSN